MKTLKLLFAAVATVGTIGVAAPHASAQDLDCRSAVGAVTVDTLIVPVGATCTLTGTRVLGSIKIEPGAVLRASRVVVDGNVEGVGSRLVTIGGSEIRGSIQMDEGRATTVRTTTVWGDVQLKQATGLQTVDRNTVRGSVEITAGTGGASVTLNRVTGNLNCEDNFPLPTGAANTVGGNKENQCATF